VGSVTVRSVIRRPTAIGLVCGLGLLGACGGSDDDTADTAGPVSAVGAVTVSEVWARTTPPGTTVGAVYLTATAETADALVGADVDPSVAASAMLHSTTTSSSGQTSMEPLAQLPVPAGGELVLEPAGSHIMLVDLADGLADGESFELTLRFETAGDETVTVEVRDEAP
jgi:copper(I)-binding protein